METSLCPVGKTTHFGKYENGNNVIVLKRVNTDFGALVSTRQRASLAVFPSCWRCILRTISILRLGTPAKNMHTAYSQTCEGSKMMLMGREEINLIGWMNTLQ